MNFEKLLPVTGGKGHTVTRASEFIFERLKYLWNKCESDLLYNKASDFIRRVLINDELS